MARIPTWERTYDAQVYPGTSDGWLQLAYLNPGDTVQRTIVNWQWYIPSSSFVASDYYTGWVVAVAVTYGTATLPPPFPVNPAALPPTDDYLWWSTDTLVHNSLTSSTYYTIPWDPPGRIDTPVQRGPVQYDAAVWLAWGNNNKQHNQGWFVSSSVLVLRDTTATSLDRRLSTRPDLASMGAPEPTSEATP